MSSAAILSVGQQDAHLIAAKDVKDGNLMNDHWIPIHDVDNPYVQGIGEFAVREHDKEAKDHLIYKSVQQGWTKPRIGGILYRLIIKAILIQFPIPHEGTYEAIVLDTTTLPVERKLESFQPVN